MRYCATITSARRSVVALNLRVTGFSRFTTFCRGGGVAIIACQTW
jgi:hypothetical protein